MRRGRTNIVGLKKVAMPTTELIRYDFFSHVFPWKIVSLKLCVALFNRFLLLLKCIPVRGGVTTTGIEQNDYS